LMSLPISFSSVSSIDIPDSVEIIEARLEISPCPLVLDFGRESRLCWMLLLDPLSDTLPKAYLRVSVRRLKAIRANLEFVS
jgi:hypothetical protein